MIELFENLYNKHKETVYKYILVSLNFNHDLANDCMQDVFLLLLHKQEVVLAHPNPGGFIIVTARNFIKRHKTAQYNHAKKLAPLDDKTAGLVYHDDLRHIYNTLPDTETLKSSILQRLNNKEISLYSFFYERGFTVADIAMRLNITENNVKVRLFRLRIKVKQMVQEMFK